MRWLERRGTADLRERARDGAEFKDGESWHEQHGRDGDGPA